MRRPLQDAIRPVGRSGRWVRWYFGIESLRSPSSDEDAQLVTRRFTADEMINAFVVALEDPASSIAQSVGRRTARRSPGVIG